MELIIQSLVGLAALMLTGLGVMSMFAPRKMVGNFAIEPIGTAGLSTIRSVIGGLFLSSVALLAVGLLQGQTILFVAVAAILGIVAIGRIVGIITDGFDKAVVPPLLVEIVMVTILLTTYTQLG
jgi:hypothetical protein